MINYDYYQLSGIASMVMDRELFDRQSELHLDRDDFIKLTQFLEINNIQTITEVYAVIDGNWLKSGFNEPIVTQLFQTIKKIDDPIADFDLAVQKLSEKTQVEKILNIIREAVHWIGEGLIDYGINKLSEIEYSEPKQDKSAFITLLDLGIRTFTNISPTGIKAIDQMNGGFDRGNLITICGAEGTMKTRVSLYLLFQIMKANPKFNAVYFEKEMTAGDLMGIVISLLTGQPYNDLLKQVVDRTELINIISEKLIEPEHYWIKDILFRLTIITGEDFDNASDMIKYIKRTKADVWVLDYFTCLGESSTISAAYSFWETQTKQLKRLARSTNSTGIILAQLKQNTIGSDFRVNKIALKSDIEFGFKLTQMSTAIFTTFHPSQYHKALAPDYYFYLVPLKNRRGGLFYSSDSKSREPYIIPLIAEPAKGTFKEPVGEERTNMLDWLKRYTERSYG